MNDPLIYSGEWKVFTVKGMKEVDGHYEILRSDGFSMQVPIAECSRVPAVGDEGRFRELGDDVVGLRLVDREIFNIDDKTYKKLFEERHAEVLAATQARFKKVEKRLDRIFTRLPAELKERIARFRSNNPNFRLYFEEREMLCNQDAYRLIKQLKTSKKVSDLYRRTKFKNLVKLPYFDESHTPQTIEHAGRLAEMYLKSPGLVGFIHGLDCPMVGCIAYGCLTTQEVKDLSAQQKKEQQVSPEA